MKPNILLIVFDTARADAFEPYGAPSGASPVIGQMAESGLAHPRAYAPASWTVPSHSALFTGLMPNASGIHLGKQDSSSFIQVMRHHRERVLATVMSKAGYRTVGISGNGWIAEHSGFSIGFDEFHTVVSQRHYDLGSKELKTKARWAVQGLRAKLDDGAAAVANLIRETSRHPEPFFCFVNLVECHSPYLPPRPYNSLGWLDRLRSVQDANRYCTFESFWLQAFGSTHVPAESTARMRTLYTDSIRQLDAWVAQVFDGLREAKILEDTQVIITSDHGENFGEGGLTGHTFSLDERLIRIPFVTSGPLELDFGTIMSLADVPGSLAGALGLRDNPWAEDPASDMVAVAQFAAPAQPGDPVIEGRMDSYGLGDDARRKLYRSFQCATDGRWKLIRDATGEYVLDLVRDPLEVRPELTSGMSAAIDPDVLGALRTALDDSERATLRDLPAVDDDDSAPTDNDQDALEKQMRLLGYL